MTVFLVTPNNASSNNPTFIVYAANEKEARHAAGAAIDQMKEPPVGNAPSMNLVYADAARSTCEEIPVPVSEQLNNIITILYLGHTYTLARGAAKQLQS